MKKVRTPKRKEISRAIGEYKRIKARNWLAVHAHFKSGAGHHGDKKKQSNKRACRSFNARSYNG